MNEKQLLQKLTEAFGAVQPKKVLIGAEAIMAYLSRIDGSPISRHTFLKFVKMGMPACTIDGLWYAHVDNIDRFFQQRTNVRMKQIPDDAE